MKIDVKVGEQKSSCNVLVIPFFKDEQSALIKVDSFLGGLLKDTVKREELFEDGKGKTFAVKGLPYTTVYIHSLGEKSKLTFEKLRKFAGTSVQIAKSLKGTNIAFAPLLYDEKNISAKNVSFALAEGLFLGNYAFDRFKSKDKQKEIEHVTFFVRTSSEENHFGKGIQKARIISESVNLVRDLVNLPANIVTTEYLANIAKESVKGTKVQCKILDVAEIKKEKLTLIQGVCMGSRHEPKIAVLTYNGTKKNTNPLVLVGKGVCFDSGGLQIKPSSAMMDMKSDMAGAATVIAVIKAIAKLNLSVHIIGICPIVENMPSGTAYHPGDIFITPSGKSVEIGHTDAEGRLILADGLWYSHRFKPKEIIDIATLTGACIVALGTCATGVMTTSKTMMKNLTQAGQVTNEKVWELPLFDEYFEDIKSDVADIKNIGSPTGDAGAITAAFFLKEFVKDVPWAHLDIAGPSMAKKGNGYIPRGATGIPVRLLVNYIEQSQE